MNKTEIMNSITRGFYRAGFQLKKHSPEILVVTGVVGVVASAFMACRASTKLDIVLDETRERAEKIRTGAENGEAECYQEDGSVALVPYTPEMAKKDLTIVYAKTGLQLVKMYGPALLIGAASIGCILGSHRIMHTRNAALAAAYATVDRGFKDYRGRVIERFGEELDRELKYNLQSEEVETRVVNEDGSETVTTETRLVSKMDPNGYSMFARCFTVGSLGWSPDPTLSLWWLKQQQLMANDRLRSRGHLTLNEVYESLGIAPSKEGFAVGWVYDPKNPDIDNFVDFGIYDENNPKAIRFVHGEEDSIWLDFNVAGVVHELLEQRDGLRFRRER